LAEAEIMVGIEKKKIKIFRTTTLYWSGKFGWPSRTKFQNFPHHHSCLRQKFLLALKKKISIFSAPQPLAEAENLIGLGEKKFKIFRTTRVA
jgi:hypothetical protein